MPDLFPLGPAVNLAIFVAAATGVWFAGSRLTYLADVLSDRLGLAKSLTGLVLLALATSLPEVATTLSAAARQNAELVLNNLFGGVALQTAILATADLWARSAITNYPRKATHALEATLLIALLAMASVAIETGEPVTFGGVGLGSIAIAVVYVGAVFLLRRYEGANDWTPVDIPDQMTPAAIAAYDIGREAHAGRLAAMAALACAGVFVCGVALVGAAEVIATQSGLGAGFVGATLLAGATSLPELTTTVAAVRIGSYTLAISNIFGSNLIMIVLVALADVIHRSGPILREPGPTSAIAIGFGIFVTAIFLVGLIVRRKPTIGRLGLDSALVIVAFLVSLACYLAVA